MSKLSTNSTPARLRARYRRAQRNRSSMAELQASAPSELHRLPPGIRFSHAGRRSLGCSHPGPTQLMPRRLQELGIDIAYVQFAQTAVYRDLERLCATCKAWRRCARDLANGDVQVGMRTYCLNSPTIDALTVGREVPQPA